MKIKKTSLSLTSDLSQKRSAAEKRFRLYGLIAISIGILMLIILVATILSKGLTAFQQTFITLDVELILSLIHI